MLQFIITCVIAWFLYEKVFRVGAQIGNEYLKKESKRLIDLLNEKPLPITEIKRDYHIKLIAPSPLIFNDTIRYIADPSDIIGIYVHTVVDLLPNGIQQIRELPKAPQLWRDEYGSYRVVHEEKSGFYSMQYITYTPDVCPICGEKIWYNAPIHPLTNNPVNTSMSLDSESRYCKKCREQLNKVDTEAYYPFFIDSVGHKLITSSDDKFEEYMNMCNAIPFADTEKDRVGYNEISSFYDEALRNSTLTEYTKNIGVAHNWLLCKGLK